MKKKTASFSLLAIISLLTLWCALSGAYYSGHQRGYDRGYARGIQDERLCWTVDPASMEQWSYGVVTARRDMARHPFSRATPILSISGGQINSVPVTVPSPKQ